MGYIACQKKIFLNSFQYNTYLLAFVCSWFFFFFIVCLNILIKKINVDDTTKYTYIEIYFPSQNTKAITHIIAINIIAMRNFFFRIWLR